MKVKLSVGDLVLLRVRHLSNAFDKVLDHFFHLFEHLYKIIQYIDENAFLFVDYQNEQKKIGIYNRRNLRIYYSNKDNVQEK